MHGPGALFAVAGARPRREGIGFFNEFLRSEYHPIRHTLEQYMRQVFPEGLNEPAVCGLGFRKGSSGPVTLRVTREDGLVKEVTVDRWN